MQSKIGATRQVIAATTVICILAVAIFVLSIQHNKPLYTYYELRIDGERIGYVAEPDIVHNAVFSLKLQAENEEGAALAASNVIEFVPFTGDSLPEMMRFEEIIEEVEKRITFTTAGYVIAVDGREVVALGTKEAAEEVVWAIQAQVQDAILSRSNVSLKTLAFAEDIQILERIVDPKMLRTVDEAKLILMRGTDKVLSYTVKRGDSLWAIASANRMSVDDLRKANPEIKGDLIREGQSLNLVVPEPYVNVLTEEEMTYTVAIPFPTVTEKDPSMWPWQRQIKQHGVVGQREVTVKIHRVNGVETHRETLSSRVLKEPVTQIVVEGSKTVPDLGTGSFVWPLSGTITSGFGWRRSGFHSGIDIAAPVGSPIVAADSGTVIYSGWHGNYGLCVMIDHGGGKVTLYGHNSQNLVKVGDVVQKGQVIAKVGSTGRSTGPHVHFEVRVDGKAVNPINFYR
ncbi:MAG: M23 family metallopeptidase [Bacillota bacterium]